jgi:hypothetical protein
MSHIGVKYSKEIKIDFDFNEAIENCELPDKSKEIINEYIQNNKFAEDYDLDLMLVSEDSIITGFEFLTNGRKIKLPEINPVTIYFANSIMSSKNILPLKKQLIKNAESGIMNPHSFAEYFQLSFNCIINLQASVETFLNKLLDEKNYVFTYNNGRERIGKIHEKIDNVIPELYGKSFQSEFPSEYNDLKELINLRNKIIHLNPENGQTNSKYKIPYRQILEFNFDKAISSAKNFINFYESNLIEQCDCGKDFYFDIVEM